MSSIATKNSLCSGHAGFPSRPPAEAESLMNINGVPVLVDGKQYLVHTDGNSSHSGQSLTSRSWFKINGKGVICVGDALSCGSTVAMGDSTVNIS